MLSGAFTGSFDPLDFACTIAAVVGRAGAALATPRPMPEPRMPAVRTASMAEKNHRLAISSTHR